MKKTFRQPPLFYSFLLTILTLFSSLSLTAQDVVSWSHKLIDNGTPEKTIVITAKIKNHWHLYDQNLPEGGPNSLVFHTDEIRGAHLVGKFVASKKPDKEYDDIFEMEVRHYAGEVSFSQKIKVTNPRNFVFKGYLKGQACQENCVQLEHEYAFSTKDLKVIQAVEDASLENEAPVDAEDTAMVALQAPEAMASATASVSSSDLWTPVISELKAYGDKNQSQIDSSLWLIFVYGFLGGLIALLTPCVWPMIPMTVSFFLKRTKNKKDAITDALIYGFSIIVIYLLLGLFVSFAFGASALNDLATHAVFNIIFFLLLVVFAVSFFGAFELTLPAKWTNRLDSKADSTTGMVSIFFMAFTLVLVSFSCTGPIIGTLLVEATSKGSLLGPAVGMFGFAFALALPFSLFAIFPNLLQSMPKSGGWLNSVKVVLGFLELALSLKFLSVADLAYGWGILDRETFLALWIVIFILLGVYLLGKIQLSHDTPLEKLSVSRLFMAIISFAFAVYMLPGLWGAPLKAISAFAPPLKTQDFNLYDGEVHAQFEDFEEGIRYAKSQNKPVLIDFSGHGCVNCREMENSVWIDPSVKEMLEKDFVLITLMVDEKKALPSTIEVEENGTIRKLRTVGDKWSYLQRTKFGANAQPYYVALDHNGKPISPSYSHDKSIDKYKTFLKNALKEFRNTQAKGNAVE